MTSPRRIRVLRVIARLNVGGPAIHATLLTERLDPSRYESILVAGAEEAAEGDYLDLQQASVSTIRRIPELGREIRGGQDVVALRKLVALIRETQPDIVHTHTAKAGTLGRLAAWWCGVPHVVHTYHGHVFHGYFSPAKTRAFVAIERWLARRTQCLVTVSPQVRREILGRGIGDPSRFKVIPLGLELDRYLTAETCRGRLRAELNLPADAFTVGIVARLVPIKAHETFFEAARHIAAAHPGAWFLVVGDGERREALEALAARLGVAGRTRFLGWRADLDAVYADLDAVVLTSRNEGLPVALIEAMAAGRPVVSTRAGGVTDLVSDGKTGLLAAIDDAPEIARLVGTLLEAPALGARLGAAARAQVYPTYTAQRLLDNVDALYRELVDGSV